MHWKTKERIFRRLSLKGFKIWLFFGEKLKTLINIYLRNTAKRFHQVLSIDQNSTHPKRKKILQRRNFTLTKKRNKKKDKEYQNQNLQQEMLRIMMAKSISTNIINSLNWQLKSTTLNFKSWELNTNKSRWLVLMKMMQGLWFPRYLQLLSLNMSLTGINSQILCFTLWLKNSLQVLDLQKYPKNHRNKGSLIKRLNFKRKMVCLSFQKKMNMLTILKTTNLFTKNLQ